MDLQGTEESFFYNFQKIIFTIIFIFLLSVQVLLGGSSLPRNNEILRHKPDKGWENSVN